VGAPPNYRLGAFPHLWTPPPVQAFFEEVVDVSMLPSRPLISDGCLALCGSSRTGTNHKCGAPRHYEVQSGSFRPSRRLLGPYPHSTDYTWRRPRSAKLTGPDCGRSSVVFRFPIRRPISRHLLARRDVTSMRGLRGRASVTMTPWGRPRLLSTCCSTTALLRMISRRLRDVRSPIFGCRPELLLAACRSLKGVRPSQQQVRGPFSKGLGAAVPRAAIAVAEIVVADAVNVHQPSRYFGSRSTLRDLLVQRFRDPAVETSEQV